MIVFDTPTLQNANGNNLIVTKTLSSTTRAMTVTNYSHFFLRVDSDITNGFGILPPFTTQTFAVRPGQQVTFTCQSSTVSAQPQANEQVSFSESTLEYATGLQSLSLPVYAQTVIGLQLNEDPNSGIFPAYATAQKILFQNKINYFEFWNFDTSGKDLWINFLHAPTGQGGPGDIKIPADPNGGGQGGYYSTPANYDSVWVMGGAGQVVGWYSNG